MGLKVYKADEASRDYENDFFREFSSNLVKMFEEEGLDGILIGHPNIPEQKYLKPDCVLITPNRMILIDFKNHSGKIWLPDAASFENAYWRHNDGVIVAGGTSINPFAQLKRQQDLMEKLIGQSTYGKYGIACVVCFQGDMNIMNQVPGKYQSWFSVTNKYHYLNRIRDIIGVKNNNRADINKLLSYFDAKPYHDYYNVSLKDVEAVNEANERSAKADRREYEARQKVEELERKIKEAEKEKRVASNLQDELERAKREANSAKRAAEIAKNEFDEKRHTLELETQKAIKARAYADKAKAEEKKAEIDANVAINQTKTRRIVATIIAIVAVIGIFAGIWSIIDHNNRTEQQKADEAAKLEEDYKNGRICIPVERVADFLNSKGVCVDFYANYINDSPKYVFIDSTKNGNFALMISKELISEADAKTNYLNKHLEARGTIIKYNDTYEIKIEDLSQITVK